MRLVRLCKIEWYRFFHSLEIVKYFIIVPFVLVAMCYINIFSVRYDISTVAVWGSLSSIYLYIMITLIILISIYIGREYYYKTINYEVIREYGMCRIVVAKTVTCGLFVPVVYTISIWMYLFLMIDDFIPEYTLRIILFCILHMHICTATMLYVILCKNGIIGGLIAFARFFIGEIVLQSIFSNNKIMLEHFIIRLQVFKQWSDLICIDIPIKMSDVWMILLTTIAEYGFLLFIIQINKKYYDIH